MKHMKKLLNALYFIFENTYKELYAFIARMRIYINSSF